MAPGLGGCTAGSWGDPQLAPETVFFLNGWRKRFEAAARQAGPGPSPSCLLLPVARPPLGAAACGPLQNRGQSSAVQKPSLGAFPSPRSPRKLASGAKAPALDRPARRFEAHGLGKWERSAAAWLVSWPMRAASLGGASLLSRTGQQWERQTKRPPTHRFPMNPGSPPAVSASTPPNGSTNRTPLGWLLIARVAGSGALRQTAVSCRRGG